MNTSANATPADPRTPAPRRPKLYWIAAAVIVLALGMWQVVASLRSFPPLPDLATVRAIEADFYDQEQHKLVEFAVPREHWNTIFSALTPAQKDAHPAKWVGMGELRFQLASGEPWVVTLYEGDGDHGAFSAGPSWERRTYYRGGNTSELRDAMTAARHPVAKLPD